MALIQRVSRFLVVACAIQVWRSTMNFSKHFYLSDIPQHQIDAVVSAVTIPTTVYEFGAKAKAFAAMIDLANFHINHPSTSSSDLTGALKQILPWWDEDKMPYFPWKKGQWSDTFAHTFKKNQLPAGIMITVNKGDVRLLPHIVMNLRIALGSKLPIQIACWRGDGISSKAKGLLQTLASDVEFIDLSKIFDEGSLDLRSTPIGPLALLASKYPQTILVDASVLFFTAPDELLHSSYLQKDGVIFFHDMTVTESNNASSQVRRSWINDQLREAGRYPSRHLNYTSLFYKGYVMDEATASVVIFDKSKPETFFPLLFTAWINQPPVHSLVTTPLGILPKEMFWLAFELTGSPYTFSSYYPGRVAVEIPRPQDRDSLFSIIGRAPRLCSRHSIHMMPNNERPLFLSGSLWADRVNTKRGFVPLTHYWIGEPVDAIEDMKRITGFDPIFLPDIGGNIDGPSSPERQLRKDAALRSQAKWDTEDWERDSQGCFQYDESRWKSLAMEDIARLKDLTVLVKEVEARWSTEVGP